MRAKNVAYYFLSVEILHDKIGPNITSTTEQLVAMLHLLHALCTINFLAYNYLDCKFHSLFERSFFSFMFGVTSKLDLNNHVFQLKELEQTCMRAKIVAQYFLIVEILYEKIGPIITSTTEQLVAMVHLLHALYS